MEKLFAYFIKSGKDTSETTNRKLVLAEWFLENFPEEEFRKEELLFYKALEWSVKLETLLSTHTFETYVKTDGMYYLMKSGLRIEGTEDLTDLNDLSKVESLKERTIEIMSAFIKDLMGMKPEVDEFIVDAKEFIQKRLSEGLTNTMATAFTMQSTMESGKYGASEAQTYLLEEVSRLKDIYDGSSLDDLTDVKEVSKQQEKISDTGLPAIDRDMLGIRRGNLIGVEADTGIGKTKFAIGVLAYRALVLNKRNVLYYTIEQNAEEIIANLVSRHIFAMYRKVVPAYNIYTGELPAELQQLVTASRIDLLESGKYGKFKVFNKDVFIEDFVEMIKRDDRRHGGFDVVIIDYMGLIEQRPSTGKYSKHLEEYQIIRKAYRKFKRYCNSTGKVGIAVNQLNDRGAEHAKKGQDITTSDAQGGREVYKSPDYNMTIVATPEMEKRHKREIVNPKKRNSEGAGRILLDTQLACCYWEQTKKENI